MADAADSKSARPFPDHHDSQGFTTIPENRATTARTTGAIIDPTREHASGFNDPDLARLAVAWPDLPEPIRVGILAMLDACSRHPGL